MYSAPTSQRLARFLFTSFLLEYLWIVEKGTKMKTVYVGMALTEAPLEFRDDFQIELKSALRELTDVVVLDFVGLENGGAVEVYRHDRRCTELADLCVFITDCASTGMGMEIWIRRTTQKRMLLFAKLNQKVTRMLIGFAEDEGIPFIRYANVSDIVAVIKAELEKM